MERTLRLYPRYQLAAQMYFWLPITVLYFTRTLTLGQALQLEAIYYLGVVVLEVPSGYLADRLGRRRALLVAALCGMGAHATFVVGQSFEAFAAAQLLLAGSIAFASGSDSALLYDAMVAAGREGDYAEAEGRAGSWGFAGSAVAAITAGLVATFVDIRAAFVLSFGAQLAAFGIAFAMAEPPTARASASFFGQLGDCVRRTRTSPLTWALGFYTLATVINHVPYELYQPYLSLLIGSEMAPLAAGALAAGTMVVAGVASRRAVWLAERFGGPVVVLSATLLLSLAITWAIGLWLHWVLVLVLLARSIPSAIQRPLMRALVNPEVPSEMRATYLSLMSLVGRLAFAVTLGIASGVVGQEHLSWGGVSTLALGYAAIGGLLGLLVVVAAPGEGVEGG